MIFSLNVIFLNFKRFARTFNRPNERLIEYCVFERFITFVDFLYGKGPYGSCVLSVLTLRLKYLWTGA